MPSSDALMMVFARNAFYKRMHYLALAALCLSLILLLTLISVLYYVVRHPTHPLYFVTDNVGRLIKEIPVATPNMSLDDVVSWTVTAIQEAFSYDYVNYRLQLQSAEKYFTSYGWSRYMKALTENNNLVALIQRKQIVNAQVVSPPKIITQGILSGAYAWKFEMPLLVTYWDSPYDDKAKFANPFVVQVIVQRQPILQSYKGLGILQVIATLEAGASQPNEISGTPGG